MGRIKETASHVPFHENRRNRAVFFSKGRLEHVLILTVLCVDRLLLLRKYSSGVGRRTSELSTRQ